ncbi:UPF0182 family protein [Acidobacteria bacterium AH-259-A15]|nr:UPF0182 family protein [Acidobacteria bacterium AH-259-A15]
MNIRSTAVLLLALLIWFVLAGGISLYVDYLWFDSVGYLEVFVTTLSAKFSAWLIGFLLSFTLLGLNLWLASRRPGGTYFLREDLIEIAKKGSYYLSWVAILVLSTVIGLGVQPQWMTFLQYLHGGMTGLTDPIFEKDIAFYFFSLPVLSFSTNFALVLIVLSLLLSAASYVVHGHLGYLGKLRLSFPARLHLSFLVGIGFLLIAFRFWLKRFDLLYSEQGVTFGAGYADIHAWLPSYWILVILSTVTAVLFFLSTLAKTLRLAAMTGVGFAAAYLLINVYPSLIQTFIVEPNELQREQPYIEHTIRMTLQAYNLDKIDVHNFTVTGGLTLEDLEKNAGTVRNIRLWDWRPLMDAYGQLQSIRSYYEFQDVDLDRYVIDGNYRQVVLSARELDFSKMSEQAQTWINQYFQYTHGYGLCASPVNEVTREGLPEFFIKDIPPRSRVDLQVTRPEIYFGEKTDSPVFVKTKMEEFDYPMGDQNAFTTYQADRGLSIASFFRKLLFAWELRSYKILFTGNLTSESRVLLHRLVPDRVRKIAPFFFYDRDPYIVIHEGRLLWIQDAYTTTERYPYSEPYQNRLNYIRNSVKVVVDSYLGDVTFYIADPADPLIQVYARIFPNMFRSIDEMPEELRRHVRYPEDLFAIQSHIYQTYHMRNPTVYYNQEDLWEIPTEIYRGNEQLMESYYVIMSLPGSTQEEFILLIPFTPKNKNNMIAWMAGRSDDEHYGKLVLYQFPKRELTYGPMQIEARIDQDPNISQLITLWSQKGSQVIRGNLLVIPIENSLLYVEPLYLQAEKSEIPELTRIITVYENRVGMGETLQEALQAVIGETPMRRPPETALAAPTKVTEGPSGQDLLQKAIEHFKNSREYLQQGNWAAYGEEQRKLGEALDELSSTQREQ